ncbi:MAG: tripartite tricarboxylate transporter substrate binding protein [Betaproteobacteria bacterium]|nr:tripartite tricarboxylate transporter substrate binding protein [Betaproteobacteria bacterium]
MLVARFAACMFSAGMTVLAPGAAWAQNYPTKPVRVVTTAAGSGSDLGARLISHGLSGNLGQQVIVDNRGGSAVIAAGVVSKAPPDGYTLLYYPSPLWLLPFLQDNVPYDPVKDFSPITWTTMAPNFLVVHPSLPVRSVRELIALAKARPGELNYATGPAGTTNHLSAELFRIRAGVNIVRVPYKGTSPALNALFGGEVHLMFAPAGGVAPHLKSGRLRALAVTSAKPSPLAPGLPTVAASGLPGYESVTMVGMFAPAGTPASLITFLNQEVVRVLNRADVKEKFFGAGVETVGSAPEAFAAAIRADMATMGKVITDAGIRGE